MPEFKKTNKQKRKKQPNPLFFKDFKIIKIILKIANSDEF